MTKTKTEAQRRALWQRRLDRARAACSEERQRMDRREEYYAGSRRIPRADGTGDAKPAGGVRNIVYELIESQVDSSIPRPKITALHPEDRPLARRLEALLEGEVRRLHLKEMNDLQERTVPIQGGDYWHVEWDPQGGFHCTMGALTVTGRHPRQVIPQPGVTDIDRMDYLFVLVSQTREAIHRRYGVTLPAAAEEDPELLPLGEGVEPSEELVTQNIAYYRNAKGGIGMFSWAGDVTLEDLEDYQARRTEVCSACGARKEGDICPVCGGRRFAAAACAEEVLLQDVTIAGGEVLPAVTPGPDTVLTGPDGSPLLDETTGQPIPAPGKAVHTVIPAYRPGVFPVVLRRNVRRYGKLLGSSDVDVIADQQDAINKYGTKIQEKLLKGGSYVTLPQGVGVETTDRELKIIRVKNPADRALISVLNIQPDTSRDQQMLEVNYSWAKSTLGITDSYQGKFDATAISGVAKQFAASQAAGRLQSKREMKNQAYARLYEVMFRFLLAYTDQPWPLTWQEEDGTQGFGHFDRYAFLKRDAAGQLYWNDEFLFEVDPASNLTSNREALWAMVDDKYRAGAFGPAALPESQHRLWTLLAQEGFPHAEAVRQSIEAQLEMQTVGAQTAGTQTAEEESPEKWENSAPGQVL